MTITLTLPPETEQRIVATAEALHMPVEAYVLSLVESAHPKIQPPSITGESTEEFMAALTMLRRPGQKPLHPHETWSRATIYQDHD